ncbi:hypothetical protein E2C01_002630 [Portunus trituberculatus]|uniref:Uncharacterized protein n=1 Tax=Portunus trituberculatus TaxID=210409 RepID=A0A5B7CL92_PORTR|nr:hypothetical protein [Portunus trituberculatus]
MPLRLSLLPELANGCQLRSWRRWRVRLLTLARLGPPPTSSGQPNFFADRTRLLLSRTGYVLWGFLLVCGGVCLCSEERNVTAPRYGKHSPPPHPALDSPRVDLC